jgi:hypothetical protein
MFLGIAFAHVYVIVARFVDGKKVVFLPVFVVAIDMMQMYLLSTNHF